MNFLSSRDSETKNQIAKSSGFVDFKMTANENALTQPKFVLGINWYHTRCVAGQIDHNTKKSLFLIQQCFKIFVLWSNRLEAHFV